jgi:glycosyltransferase involved in cell wall biosynthesis
MNTQPDFDYSAILTCHNGQETIGRAIEGIFSQTLLPRELIIVDDFSSDDSIRKIKQYDNLKVPITLLQNKSNMGQSWSRNHAIFKAHTNFAVIFDDDDFSLPGRAAEHITMFQQGATINFVSSRKIYGNGHEVILTNPDLILTELSPRKALLNTLVGESIHGFELVAIPASTSAISIQEFLEIGGYDEEFRRLEDADLFIRYSESSQSIAWSSRILVNRYATFGNQKGGSIETDFELEILKKFQYLLTTQEFKYAKNLIEIRSSYFEKSYMALTKMIVANPSKLWILLTKSKNAMRRILHDLRIRGKG